MFTGAIAERVAIRKEFFECGNVRVWLSIENGSSRVCVSAGGASMNPTSAATLFCFISMILCVCGGGRVFMFHKRLTTHSERTNRPSHFDMWDGHHYTWLCNGEPGFFQREIRNAKWEIRKGTRPRFFQWPWEYAWSALSLEMQRKHEWMGDAAEPHEKNPLE